MINGTSLFFNLINNFGICVILVAGYSLILPGVQSFRSTLRQLVLGAYFGLIAIGTMHVNITVSEGIILDQRGTIIVLGGFFGGPLSGVVCGVFALIYRMILGGQSALGGAIGIVITTVIGGVLYARRSQVNTLQKAMLLALLPAILPLAGFLNIDTLSSSITLLFTFGLPYCLAVYVSVLLSGLLLANEERRLLTRIRLEHSETKYRELFESLLDITFRADIDGKIEFISPSIANLCGLSPDSIIGKPVRELFKNPVDYDNFRAHFLLNGYLKNGEAEILRMDGTAFWVSLNLQLLRKTDGCIAGEEGSIRDISSIKIREEEHRKLELSERHNQKMESIGTLAGGIAHDFNNILAAIIGYAEMAQQKLSEDDQIYQDILGIIRSASRAKELVRHILIFSRRTSYDAGPVEMYLMIKEVVKMIEATLPPNVSIEQKIKCRNGVILADPTEIHQVILNLCSNAVDAMDGKIGQLSILLDRSSFTKEHLALEPDCTAGNYIILSISDTGIGILPAHLSRVFDPFFTTKEVGKGSGLGLSVVHGIVKRLGGFITIKSTPGEGTSVTIALPEIPTEQPSPRAENEHQASGERILFVDDEQIVLTVTKKLLEQLGYRVTTSLSSEEAYELFKKSPSSFDLVLTDQTMPKMTGVQLTKGILAIRPDIPVIMSTGYSVDVDAERAKALGVSDYLMKPMDVKKLAQAIRKALDR